jgi:acetylornithine deacetylase/succinyl-diaminopimelate desuccinylase-like protein
VKNETERQIIKAVDSGGPRLASTLQDLIRFESIVMSDPTKAGPGERLCQEYLERRLAESGFETDLWEPDNPAHKRAVTSPAVQFSPADEKGTVVENRSCSRAISTLCHRVRRRIGCIPLSQGNKCRTESTVEERST